ncbi:hypothetical protein [Bizionia paragorgiae]|uniref:hypothetical protein n=1 Tax=Bizionia paragorgiae TaxID=283786 RepID=UPI00299E28D3|nr:hypothetical protein [Bizionia paragorgiae]MDX1272438.1 hypothetical protein [Bizionia paragorgiae]
MYQERLKLYDNIVSKCERFTRKGKTMPHTAANGYMFSLLNKAGEIGFRFDKATQEKYIKQFSSTHYTSYNAIMKGYVLIPETMHSDVDLLADYLNESYDYVMRLPSK